MLKQLYFYSIDSIPLFNYKNAIKGELEYCRKDYAKGSPESDAEAWALVYDDYLKTFGLGDKYERFAALQIELTKLNLEYAEKGTRFLLNKINVLGVELDAMLGGSVADIDDLIVYVIRTGYPVDEKAINTKVFFKLVELCTTENKAKNGRQTN